MWGKQGFAAVQDAIDTHIGNWDPDEAQDIEEFFGGFADYWRNQGATFSHLADRMGSELPIAAAVRDLVEEVAAACSIVGDRADEVYSAHRIEHETELERVENPRPGEEKWNV